MKRELSKSEKIIREIKLRLTRFNLYLVHKKQAYTLNEFITLKALQRDLVEELKAIKVRDYDCSGGTIKETIYKTYGINIPINYNLYQAIEVMEKLGVKE